MVKYVDDAREFWDKRYKNEGKVWGDSPSKTAQHALELFRRTGVKRILVPGSGYGRNTKLFSISGFTVTGVEISPVAYDLAKRFDPLSRFYSGSALEMSADREKYDAVYCFNVLHLFREKERGILIQECANRLNKHGVMFFVVFSEMESSFGSGNEVEVNTFESRPGRPAHYFTEADLKAHFIKYDVVETGLMEDPEDHDGKPHTHMLRYIYVRL
jgi:SAM-dependent methyltransferase